MFHDKTPLRELVARMAFNSDRKTTEAVWDWLLKSDFARHFRTYLKRKTGRENWTFDTLEARISVEQLNPSRAHFDMDDFISDFLSLLVTERAGEGAYFETSGFVGLGW